MKTIAKPFVKWAGGKSQILDDIRAKYPAELGKGITRYAEPFVGGGAVLFDILNRYTLESVYISDINRELITAYTVIRDNADALIDSLYIMQCDYWQANEETRKIYYYAKRERFNTLKTEQSNNIEIAALFIFLNRTCFNGLYRVNAKGGYNVPMGAYKKPSICDTENILAVSACLQGVQIVCDDYQKSREFIDNKTLAYFDPPYRPLTQTSSFTAYAQDGFGDSEQAELARFIDELSDKGAFVVASNSDPKNTNADDDFFDRLYSKHTISRISANRMINSSASGRGKKSELLIASY
ncbi:MAG: DNA adenine methylase [Clostridiales bacterium]|nr:DNA adenine methylase [Clostridiales bacterium]